MRTADLLQKWDVPDRCLVDRIVPKNAFVREGLVGKTAQKLLSEAVVKVRIAATFKAATINLSPYRDEVREYDEIHYIGVELKDEEKAGLVAELVHQTIPYPLLVILEDGENVLLSAALKRTNQADESKNTIELSVESGWIGNGEEPALLDALRIENLDFGNVYAFYRSITDALILHNAEKVYDIGVTARKGDKVRLFRVMEEIAGYGREIGRLKVEYKRTVRIGEKVELNMRMQELKAKKKALENSLQE